MKIQELEELNQHIDESTNKIKQCESDIAKKEAAYIA